MASVRAPHDWITPIGALWSQCSKCGMRGDDERANQPCTKIEIIDSPRPNEPETELSVKLKDTGKRDYYHRHLSGVACIDIIEHMPLNVGTAMKYLWRCDEKHPDPIEDLIKARWYVDREIKRRTKMLKESTNDDQTRS